MEAARLAQVKAMLFEALQLTPELRESFLQNYPNVSAAEIEEALRLLRAQVEFPPVLEQLRRGPQDAPPIVAPGYLLSERYRISEPLAMSAKSQVYLARDERLGQSLVAVKFPAGAGVDFKDVQEELWAEINSLARLRHPSVCGLIDTGTHQDCPYLVTQFVEGRDLNQWTYDYQPSAQDRFDLFIHLVTVVEAIHKSELLHLDLKPENIMVHSKPGEVPALTVIDFGISKLADLQETHSAGTPVYAAPERALGQATYASDIYSLARIGKLMLTNLPHGAAAILASGLSEDPGGRPAAAALLKKDLLTAWSRRIRQRKIFSSAVKVAVVTLIFASLWLALRRPSTKQAAPLSAITTSRGKEIEPALSTDGLTVYFGLTRELNAGTSIHRVAFEGGPSRVVYEAPDQVHYRRVTVSPDGENLAFLSDEGAKGFRVMMGASSGGAMRIVHAG